MSSFPKQVSLHGQRAYVTPDDELVAKGAFVTGGERSVGRQGGNIVLPGSPGTVAVFDDFLGDLVGDEWNYAEGDTGHAGTVAAVNNGVFRIALSATATRAPSGYALLNTGLFPQWKANQGSLRLAARLKMSALAGTNVFLGFADTGAGQMPVYDTGGGQQSPASNAVGFLYSGEATSGSTVWRGVGVNADTDKTAVDCAAPVANTYDVLEVRIGDTGTGGDGERAYFYQNGVLKGSMSAPLLGTRGLVPVLAAFKSDTGAVNVDLDWINISADRDTGE